MEMVNVLVTMPFAAPLLEKLANVSPRLNIIQHEARTAEDLPPTIKEVDVLYTFQALPLPEQAPRLRWVQLHYAGVDHLLEHPLFAKEDVLFTSTSGIHTIVIAEYVLALILAFAHHLPKMFADKASATWPQDRWARYVSRELRGATLGIVGYGSIGREVARLAQAFGMRVLAVKRDLRNLEDEGYCLPGTGDPHAEIPERIYPIEALHSFLRECDYVVLSLPLTAETHHLINAAALAAMKPTAILINVARGGLVDEKALITALEKGTIAGAGLDVYAVEPLPPDSPLWKMPNVILSPHVAGFTTHYDERATDLFAENLRRFLAEEPLLNLVDRSRGY